MGETTCLVQPFSYAAGISSNEATQGNPFHALGQSVSFGRFMSDSLSWEKWSTFSHNRYVEEAERYSRPGSVAQMKAFFEAHYKNLAARKAAALLEQANSAVANNVSETQQEVVIHDNTTQESHVVTQNSEEDADIQAHVKQMSTESRSDDVQGNGQVERVDPSTVNQVLVENAVKIEPSSQLRVVDQKEEVKEMDLAELKQMEKPLLKDFMSNEEDSASISKKKPQVSSTKSLSHSRVSKISSSPVKPSASLGARRENMVTPICRKPAVEHLDRKKSTPKSSHKSMNFTPVREINRLTSTIIRKIDSSRVSSLSKASKDVPTPIRTPAMVSANKEQKQPLATPLSENRRAKTPLQPSASGCKTVRPRWNFLPTDCSKFLTCGTNKSQSPKVSTPFSFRTEERAARRKEKLEEKFNVDQAQKAQLQATLKEKAETELKKLRQNLCFKARPLPRFYKERSTTNNQMEKVPLAHFQSPDLGRKPSPTKVESSSHQLPQRSSMKTGSKQVTCKKSHIPHSLSLRSKTRTMLENTRTTLENTSPNIQRK